MVEGTARFGPSWTDGVLPPLTGTLDISVLGPTLEIGKGRVLGVGDVANDPLTTDAAFVAMGVHAVIGVPIMRQGSWHATLYVHHSKLRRWTQDEVTTVNEVAEQTWDAVERARALEALARHADKAATSQQQMMTDLLSTLPEFVYSFDNKGRFLFANQTLLTAMDLTLKEVAGKTFKDIPAPEGLIVKQTEELHRAINTGKLVRDEAAYTGPTGVSGHFEYTFKPILDAEGRVEWVVGSGRDISERKAIEDELIVAKGKTEQALEAGNIGVWVVDLLRQVVHYDERAQSLLGVPPELPTNDRLTKIHPDDRAIVQTHLAKSLDPTGAGTAKFEVRQLDAEGKYRWLSLYSQTTFEGGCDARRPVKMTGTLQDIHERKLAELALAGLTETLESRVDERTREVRDLAAHLTLSEQAERQTLANTLHDSVQQELIALQFVLVGLRKDLEGRRAAEKLKEAEDLIKQTVRVVRNVTTNLKPRFLDEPDLCQGLTWLAKTMKKRFNLNVSLAGEKSCEVRDEAVRTLLFNLIRELLFNIVKHAESSEATIKLNFSENALEVSVADEGKGFTPNFTAPTSATGLGLIGAHKRLRLFGGTLDVTSSPGEGTRVTITIPSATLVSGWQDEKTQN